MVDHLHQDLYDWIQEGEGEDDDEVVDEPLEGELLAQAAHRDRHGRHEPGQPDEDYGQRAPTVLQNQINSQNFTFNTLCKAFFITIRSHIN